jgi:tetratricopeptide (TPR) repeat protein
MIEDKRLSRVELLVQQKRYAEAEKILKDLLSQDSGNVYSLALLAEVHLQQDKFESANQIIDSAIGLSPDTPHFFYIKSRIAGQQGKYDEAEQHIRESIELNPSNADYFAWLAHIKLVRKQYDEALELADESLELDAENLLALNTRSTALLKLNKKEASFATIEGALREDPNNAYTHANYGWGLLEKGDYKKARIHFKEALQNQPDFEYAQAGLLEAIKATNPIYRLFLKYAFFMGNLTSKYQWGVIIGFYIGFRVIRTIAEKNAALQPYLTPVIILLAIVAFSTWVIKPIGNLFLRFNKYGNLLLDRQDKMSANFVAASFGIFLVGIVLYLVTRNDQFIPVAAFGFAMMLPFSVMFSTSKRKYLLLGYTILMGVIGITAIALAFSTGDVFNFMTVLFIFSFIAFQWIANFLLIREDNK